MEFLTPYIKPREIRINIKNIKNEFDGKAKPYQDSILHTESSTASNKLPNDECGGNTNKSKLLIKTKI